MRKQNSIGIDFQRFKELPMFDLCKRAVSGLIKRNTADERTSHAPRVDDEPLLAVAGPSWHGDHWANLLSSPMDARHYVLEDWSTP
jgi:hypothetical protein